MLADNENVSFICYWPFSRLINDQSIECLSIITRSTDAETSHVPFSTFDNCYMAMWKEKTSQLFHLWFICLSVCVCAFVYTYTHTHAEHLYEWVWCLSGYHMGIHLSKNTFNAHWCETSNDKSVAINFKLLCKWLSKHVDKDNGNKNKFPTHTYTWDGHPIAMVLFH